MKQNKTTRKTTKNEHQRPKKSLQKQQRTYYIKSDYYSNKFVDNIFQNVKSKYNWKQISNLEPFIKQNRAIDFVYVDGQNRTNKQIYKAKAKVKNIVTDDKRTITLKHNLIQNLNKLPESAPFLLDQIDVDLSDPDYLEKIKSWYQPGKIYIFKPISEYAGAGIKVIEKLPALEEYAKSIIEQYHKKWEQKERDRLRIWVLQEYITNPLLIHGHKFHVRNYLFYIPSGKSFNLLHGEIAPAKLPYQTADWSNPDIHDTHFYGKDGEIFPEALDLPAEKQQLIDDQLSQMYKSILKCISAKCYPENKKCYELFGVDFIILDNYQIKLLEVNEKVGMPSETSVMTKEIFENIIKIVTQMV